MSGWPSGLRRQTQVQTCLTMLDIQCEFWSSIEGVGSNPTPDILVWIISAGSSIDFPPLFSYHLNLRLLFQNYKCPTKRVGLGRCNFYLLPVHCKACQLSWLERRANNAKVMSSILLRANFFLKSFIQFPLLKYSPFLILLFILYCKASF